VNKLDIVRRRSDVFLTGRNRLRGTLIPKALNKTKEVIQVTIEKNKTNKIQWNHLRCKCPVHNDKNHCESLDNIGSKSLMLKVPTPGRIKKFLLDSIPNPRLLSEN